MLPNQSREPKPDISIMPAEETNARYVYKGPFAANGDRRHPSVIDHQARTGIKNVVGTGRDGRLTGYDIIMAATVPDNMPEHLKTTFMTEEEKEEYERVKAGTTNKPTSKVLMKAKDAGSNDMAPASDTSQAPEALNAENTQHHSGDPSQQHNPIGNIGLLPGTASVNAAKQGPKGRTPKPPTSKGRVTTAATERPRRTMATLSEEQSRGSKSQSTFQSMPVSPALANDESEMEPINKPVALTKDMHNLEAIVGHKRHQGRVYYHVKWEGYEDDANTWELASNLNNAATILNDYRSAAHANSRIERLVAHRGYQRYIEGRKTYIFEYLVKWTALDDEFNTWEEEKAIREKHGRRILIYYRIAHNVGFGRGPWNASKQIAAIKLLQAEQLRPEPGGRISVPEVKVDIKREQEP